MLMSKKHNIPRIALIVFTVTASLLMLLSSVYNWIAFYVPRLFPKYVRGELILGRSSNDWHFRSDTFVGIHDYICVLFVMVFGIFLLFYKLSICEYIKGILFFYYIRVCVIYTFTELLDPAVITTGIKNMVYMKFRIRCWSIALLFLFIYLLRNLFRKLYNKWRVTRRKQQE